MLIVNPGPTVPVSLGSAVFEAFDGGRPALELGILHGLASWRSDVTLRASVWATGVFRWSRRT